MCLSAEAQIVCAKTETMADHVDTAYCLRQTIQWQLRRIPLQGALKLQKCIHGQSTPYLVLRGESLVLRCSTQSVAFH